jgi:hypothetical protein
MPMEHGRILGGAMNPMVCHTLVQGNRVLIPMPISIGTYTSESLMENDLRSLGAYAEGNDGTEYVVFGRSRTPRPRCWPPNPRCFNLCRPTVSHSIHSRTRWSSHRLPCRATPMRCLPLPESLVMICQTGRRAVLLQRLWPTERIIS